MFCLSLGKKARLWGWFASRTTRQEAFRNQPVPISSPFPAGSGNFSTTDLGFLNSRPSSPKALVLGSCLGNGYGPCIQDSQSWLGVLVSPVIMPVGCAQSLLRVPDSMAGLCEKTCPRQNHPSALPNLLPDHPCHLTEWFPESNGRVGPPSRGGTLR